VFHRSVKFLISGQTLSNLADVFATVTLVTMMYHMSDSVAYTALIPLVRVLSQSVSGLIAPLLLDRYKLTFLLRSSQFLQFVLFGIIALFAWLMLTPGNLWIVLVLIMIWAFLDGWTAPASNALIPRLLKDSEQVLKANGVFGTANQIAQLAGWAGGAIIVSLWGAPVTLLAVGILYGIAFIMTCLVREPDLVKVETEDQKESDTDKQSPSMWQRLREGWVIIWQRPALRTLAIMDFLEGLAGSVWVGAFLLAYVKTVLHQDDTWWGYINVSYFIGAIAGGLGIVALGKFLDRSRYASMMIGMMGYGVLTLVFGYVTNPWLALVIVLWMGPLTEIRTVAVTTMRQLSVEAEALPKVLTAMNTMISFVFGISVIGLGVLSDLWGI
jgi:MFS family permease